MNNNIHTILNETDILNLEDKSAERMDITKGYMKANFYKFQN